MGQLKLFSNYYHIEMTYEVRSIHKKQLINYVIFLENVIQANVYVSCHSPLLVILLPLSEFSGLMKILKILFN